jgi:hypothetical protein
MNVIQHVAICFAAGVIGALAVVLFSHVLFALGLSEKLDDGPARLPIAKPDCNRGLFTQPPRPCEPIKMKLTRAALRTEITFSGETV